MFWRKFTKIYQTIDNDGSGEIEFEELLRYLKITVKKQRISKEMGLKYKSKVDLFLSVMLVESFLHGKVTINILKLAH